MVYTLEPLEPLKTRTLCHTTHMSDNYAESQMKCSLLRGQKNSFHLEVYPHGVILHPPFEEVLEESLLPLIEALAKDYPQVSIQGFLESTFRDNILFAYQHQNQQFRLYQTPLHQEAYQERLKKFRKSGYVYRELTPDDIPSLVSLIGSWADEKRNSALKNQQTITITNEKSIEEAMEQLESLRNEVRYLSASSKQVEGYRRLMAQPLTHLYGAFLEDQLLAYVFTEGNDTFRAFSTRAGVRRNSFSPQEFLDLAVAEEFAKRGVKLFDRGNYSMRKGIIGLTEYKKKFGPLKVRKETDYHQITVRSSPELHYLQNNFKVEV